MEMVALVLLAILAVAIIENRRSSMQRIVAERDEDKAARPQRRRQ